MKNIAKRSLAVMTAVIMMMALFLGSAGPAKVYASDTSEDIALSVYLETDPENPVKTFTLNDLWGIAAEEGNLNYEFSGYNRHPSFYIYGNEKAYEKEDYECKGPTIKGILDAADVTVSGKQKISFVAADGVTETFTAEDLFRTRYYFPNGKGLANGSAPTDAHYKDKVETQPIFDLTRVEKDEESVLRFGQVAPNEQNIAVFNKYVADGGKIVIGGEMTDKWAAIGSPEITPGSDVLSGTEVRVEMPEVLKGRKVAIYYTTDDTEPDYGDAIYNYDKYGGINPPELSETGQVTIKFRSVGYSKLPSDTIELKYNVIEEPDGPARVENVQAVPTGAASVAVTWDITEGADGYIVYRSETDGETEEVALIDGGENTVFEDKDLQGGTEYLYSVAAFTRINNLQTVNGVISYEAKVMTDLETPVIKTVAVANTSAKMMGLKVTWGKVAGADGYEVERICSHSEKIINVSGGATIALTNNSLAASRKYTFRVRAYRVLENGTKEYSPYSVAKVGTTSALIKPVLSSVTKASYNSIKLNWTKVPGATGYEIYRYNGSTKKYALIKTVNGSSTLSFTNTALKTGTKYSYKVRAVKKNADGTTSYSTYSAVKAATPALTAPTVKLTAGKKYAVVKWNKIAGANGYKIYRSTSKNSGYKCIKTVKTGSTVSFKNTKLKSGKKYYYKVRAYRVVDKKDIYSSYSSSKYIKVK